MSIRKAWADGGGVQRADGGHGHAGDGLPLPKWEPFAGSIASVAEGVQTDVDDDDRSIAPAARHRRSSLQG